MGLKPETAHISYYFLPHSNFDNSHGVVPEDVHRLDWPHSYRL